MAPKATVYKANINVADLSRHHYINQQLTLALHPSETLERMMLRLLAWSMFAEEQLVLTKGLCEESEPELWIKNYSDEVLLWIDLGLPTEKRIKKACHQAKHVVLFTYQDNAATVWKNNTLSKLQAFRNLTIIHINDSTLAALAAQVTRTMALQVTIEDEQLLYCVGDSMLEIMPEYWKRANA